MDKRTAKLVVQDLNKKNGPTLSVLEALSMQPIPSDGYETYSIQKGDVTFLAWVKKDGSIATKVVCW